MSWTCACCKKELPDRAIENLVVTEEGDEVSVGSDCAKKIIAAGSEGFMHENGDVYLFTLSAYAETE